jgi:hypothetical protein
MELQGDRMSVVFGHILVAYATLVAPLLSYRKVRQLRRADTTTDKTRLYRRTVKVTGSLFPASRARSGVRPQAPKTKSFEPTVTQAQTLWRWRQTRRGEVQARAVLVSEVV